MNTGKLMSPDGRLETVRLWGQKPLSRKGSGVVAAHSEKRGWKLIYHHMKAKPRIMSLL